MAIKAKVIEERGSLPVGTLRFSAGRAKQAAWRRRRKRPDPPRAAETAEVGTPESRPGGGSVARVPAGGP